MRILVVSTPVGPLGSGVGGGVELTLHGLVLGLTELGHSVEVVAPEGSLHVGAVVHQVPGRLQPSSQLLARDASIELPVDPVLGAMWDVARRRAHDVDVIVNLAYDWLPLYLTPFLPVPVVHLVSMGSLNDAMDIALERVLAAHPGTLAVHSRAQACTFGHLPSVGPAGEGLRVVGNGIAVERYTFSAASDQPPWLGVVGRISPEKGLEAVAVLSQRTGLPVRVWGLMQDQAYWDRVVAEHADAVLEYQGFVSTDDLQAAIGGAVAIVMTPTWVEAFGNVAIESMACGVPVIAYDRGGPAEIVIDGVTGFLVPPDDPDALVGAVERLPTIDRSACRALVEREYTTLAQARRIEAWLDTVVGTWLPLA